MTNSNDNPVGELLHIAAVIIGNPEPLEVQNTLIRECNNDCCPFNDGNVVCMAGAGRSLIGEPRDSENFPKFCFLKKPILIWRMP